ncbi:DUF2339 domain-containing protein [Candidatus Woesearchaeota archaeon]|nr:MAG: DUF2339 domain-containing protein [Candidatus Woesearchaeota archaeon]
MGCCFSFLVFKRFFSFQYGSRSWFWRAFLESSWRAAEGLERKFIKFASGVFAVALKEDIAKLAKNQAALQKNLEILKGRVDALEQAVSGLGGASSSEAKARVGSASGEDDALAASHHAKAASASSAALERRAAAKREPRQVENLGFKVFGSVGFLLLVLGLFFLYSYAKEQGWIGPGEEIVLGVLLSAGVLLAGELSRRKQFLAFSQLLTGGGLGLLYFTFFAMYFFEKYRVALRVTFGLEAFLLLAVVAGAVALALRHDSVILAGFAFFLGYLSGILAFIDGGEGMLHPVMLYTLLLSIGLAVLVARKNWPLGIGSVIASYIVYGLVFSDAKWRAYRYGEQAGSFVPGVIYVLLGYVLVFFVLFNVLSVLLRDDEKHWQNVALSVLNAALSFRFGFLLVKEWWPSARGVFVVFFAVVYVLMAFIAKRRRLVNLFEAFIALSVTFLTIAVPIQLDNAWVSLAWLLEGLLLIFGGVRVKHAFSRLLGYLVAAIGVVRVVVWDSFMLDFGERTLIFSVTVAILWLIYVLLRDNEEVLRSEPNERFLIRLVPLVGLVLFTLFLTIEVVDWNGLFSSLRSDARQILLSIVWTVEAIVLIVAGFVNKKKVVRTFGVVLFGLVLAKLLIFDLNSVSTPYRVIVTIVVGVLALVISFVYTKNKERIEEFLKGEEEGE